MLSTRGSIVWVAALAATAVLAVRGVARAHATLLSSEPAAGSRLTVSPTRLRLVFSEPVEAALSHVSVVGPSGTAMRLSAAGDPRDVHALIAPLTLVGGGTYRVEWHVVSADGHPVGGAFGFAVGVGTASAEPAPTTDTVNAQPAPEGPWGPTLAGAPLIPVALRGLGVGALMASFGLLLFLVWGRASLDTPAGRAATAAALAAALLLAAHTVVWLANAAPEHRLDAEWLSSAIGTSVARVELARSALALLALWALVLAKREGLGLAFSFAALVASAAVGHSAAFQPAWSIPAKALHLIAAGAWLGGLLWLVIRTREASGIPAGEAGRVSSLALAAVLIVTISGVAQTLLVVPSPLEVLRSAYGSVIVAKVVGLGILIAFGAYHRRRVVPRLAAGADRATASAFGRSLSREIAVFVLVVLLGGLLAYVSPPAERDAQTTTLRELSR